MGNNIERFNEFMNHCKRKYEFFMKTGTSINDLDRFNVTYTDDTKLIYVDSQGNFIGYAEEFEYPLPYETKKVGPLIFKIEVEFLGEKFECSGNFEEQIEVRNLIKEFIEEEKSDVPIGFIPVTKMKEYL